MSSFASGVIAAKREAAAADTSTDSQAPHVKTYVDALASLVPAEALALEAVILGFTTTAVKDANGKTATTVSDPTTLKWAFWALVVLCPLLFLSGRFVGKDTAKKTPSVVITALQCLIPPAAFVAWAMLQPSSAFDAVGGGMSTAARDTIAVIAAVVLGIVAGLLGYKLNQSGPQDKTPATDASKGKTPNGKASSGTLTGTAAGGAKGT